MRKSTVVVAICATLLALPFAWRWARADGGVAPGDAVPQFMHVRGNLSLENGDPVSGTHRMRFRLYDSASDTVQYAVWEETHESVTVTQGVFNVVLGSSSLLSSEIFRAYPQLFVGVTVDGEAELPRQPLASAAYAFVAAFAHVAERVLSPAPDVACQGCVASEEVGFGYAGSKTRGGEAEKAAVAGNLACEGPCVAAGEVDFNFADSNKKAGPALGLECGTECVQPEEVSFPYAAGTEKGGAAVDVQCGQCVGPDEVSFEYAGGVGKGGDAKGLQCDKCVGSGDLADGSVTGSKLSTFGLESKVNPMIRNYVNQNCFLVFGWADSCDACTKPTRMGVINGSGGYTWETLNDDKDVDVFTFDMAGWPFSGGKVPTGQGQLKNEKVQMLGLGTAGDVNGDDRFFLGFRCR